MPVGSLSWCPKIVWGSGTILLRLPLKPPEPVSRGVGGSNETGSGMLVGYEIRRDQLLKATIRFFESEWPSVEAWLHNAQLGNSFTFYMDQNNGAYHNCYLSKPKLTEDITPVRDQDYIGVYTVELELRDVSSIRFDVNITGM